LPLNQNERIGRRQPVAVNAELDSILVGFAAAGDVGIRSVVKRLFEAFNETCPDSASSSPENALKAADALSRLSWRREGSAF
jgi:hypothetical protein